MIFIMCGCGTLKYKGTIHVVGSEPNTYLIIMTKFDIKYEIVGDLRKKIWDNYQGMKIEVKGNIVEAAKGRLIPAKLNVTEIVKVY